LRSDLANLLKNPTSLESQARILVERMAIALAASLFVRYSPAYMTEAYLSSRVMGHHGYAFGTLPANSQFEAIINRAI
jgi:putative acyl-CoA dehydrogenase